MGIIKNNSGALVGEIKYSTNGQLEKGYLRANGAVVSRIAYARLFKKIGTMFGAGDGVSTFQLPDARSAFIRGLDDGRGLDLNRINGSFQGDAIRDIVGQLRVTGASNSNWMNLVEAVSGAFTQGGNNSGWAAASMSNSYAANRITTFKASSSGVPTTDPITGENRPYNLAFLAMIKY